MQVKVATHAAADDGSDGSDDSSSLDSDEDYDGAESGAPSLKHVASDTRKRLALGSPFVRRAADAKAA